MWSERNNVGLFESSKIRFRLIFCDKWLFYRNHFLCVCMWKHEKNKILLTFLSTKPINIFPMTKKNIANVKNHIFGFCSVTLLHLLILTLSTFFFFLFFYYFFYYYFSFIHVKKFNVYLCKQKRYEGRLIKTERKWKKRNQINEHFPYLFCSLFLPDKERKWKYKII